MSNLVLIFPSFPNKKNIMREKDTSTVDDGRGGRLVSVGYNLPNSDAFYGTHSTQYYTF